jgi:uncharacterized protein YggU (UPF0235/DUF167 family)
VIRLEPHPEGTVLPVRAQPGARRDEIRGVYNGMLKISVTQAPEKGKANKAIVALLCDRLGLRKSQIQLLSGDTASRKRFLVRDTTPAALAAVLEPWIA